MPCYHPWTPPASMGLLPGVQLPCRQCIGCKLTYSSEWAARCIHETKCHLYNTWITLTYDDEHLPNSYLTGDIHPRTAQPIRSGSLNKQHVPKFLRAVRKASSRVKNAEHIRADIAGRLRYYYAGEYGEKYRRPHYHACIFGLAFADLKLVKSTNLGFKLYESELVKRLWPYGQHIIGDLNYETAGYTARYITKKITGQMSHHHYTVINHETGELLSLQPEYAEMSRMPGIGYMWYANFKNDVHRTKTSHIIIKGKKMKAPRYYDKLHKKVNPQHHNTLKKERKTAQLKNLRNTLPARLTAQEIITTHAIKNLKGDL